MGVLWIDRFKWTDKRVALLRERWGDGATSTQIADELGGGVSRNAVLGKLDRLGLLTKLTARKPKPKAAAPMHRAPPMRRAPAVVFGRLPREPAQEPTVVTMDEIEPPAVNIGILALRDAHCRWVSGHGDDGLATFCGHPKSERGGSYCEHHRKRTLLRAPPGNGRLQPGG